VSCRQGCEGRSAKHSPSAHEDVPAITACQTEFCDVVALRVEDVAPSGYAMDRATIRQSKTGRPVRFELTDQTRLAIDEYLRQTERKPGRFLFAGRGDDSRGLTAAHFRQWDLATVVRQAGQPLRMSAVGPTQMTLKWAAETALLNLGSDSECYFNHIVVRSFILPGAPAAPGGPYRRHGLRIIPETWVTLSVRRGSRSVRACMSRGRSSRDHSP